MFKTFSSITIFSLDTYASRNSNTEWLEFFNSINFSDFKLIVLIKANAKNNTKKYMYHVYVGIKVPETRIFDWCKTSFDIPDWFIMFIIHFNL